MEDINIVLATAESIAAEAAFEVTPCERFEKWYENAEKRMNPKKVSVAQVSHNFSEIS